MRYPALACLALSLLVSPVARGQAAGVVAPPEAAALSAELARLNDTLLDMKAILERITETQGLDLLMKRMELSSAQVTEIEKRLRAAESDRAEVEDQRVQVEMSMRTMLAEVESGGMDVTTEQLEAFTARHEAERERLRARMRDLDDDIAALRSKLDARRRELDDWQTYIDRRLGGI